jgi:hypothetical protein
LIIVIDGAEFRREEPREERVGSTSQALARQQVVKASVYSAQACGKKRGILSDDRIQVSASGMLLCDLDFRKNFGEIVEVDGE